MSNFSIYNIASLHAVGTLFPIMQKIINSNSVLQNNIKTNYSGQITEYLFPSDNSTINTAINNTSSTIPQTLKPVQSWPINTNALSSAPIVEPGRNVNVNIPQANVNIPLQSSSTITGNVIPSNTSSNPNNIPPVNGDDVPLIIPDDGEPVEEIPIRDPINPIRDPINPIRDPISTNPAPAPNIPTISTNPAPAPNSPTISTNPAPAPNSPTISTNPAPAPNIPTISISTSTNTDLTNDPYGNPINNTDPTDDPYGNPLNNTEPYGNSTSTGTDPMDVPYGNSTSTNTYNYYSQAPKPRPVVPSHTITNIHNYLPPSPKPRPVVPISTTNTHNYYSPDPSSFIIDEPHTPNSSVFDEPYDIPYQSEYLIKTRYQRTDSNLLDCHEHLARLYIKLKKYKEVNLHLYNQLSELHTQFNSRITILNSDAELIRNLRAELDLANHRANQSHADKQRITELTRQINGYQATVRDQALTISSLMQKITAYEASQNYNSELQAELRDARTTIRDLKSVMEANTNKYNRQLNVLRNDNAALRAKLTEYANKIHELESKIPNAKTLAELTELRRQNIELKNYLQDAVDQNHYLHGVNVQLTKELERARNNQVEINKETINKLRIRISQLEKEQQDCSKLRQELTELQAQYDNDLANYLALVQENQEKTETIEELERQLAMLREQLDAEPHRADELNKKIDQLNMELNKAQSNNERLKAKLLALHLELDKANPEDRAHLQARIAELTQQLNAANERSRWLEEVEETQQDKNQELINNVAILNKRIDELQLELDTCHNPGRIAELEKELAELKETLNKYTEDLNTLTNERDQLNITILSLENDLRICTNDEDRNKLKEQITVLKYDLMIANDKINKLENSLQLSGTELKQCTDEQITNLNNLTDLNTELNNLKIKLTNLTDLNTELTNDATEYQKQIDKLKQELADETKAVNKCIALSDDSKLSQLANENLQLREQLDKCRSELNQFNIEQEEKQNGNPPNAQAPDAQAQTIVDLTQELRDSNGQIADLQRELAQLKLRDQKQKDVIDKLTDEKVAAEERMQKLLMSGIGDISSSRNNDYDTGTDRTVPADITTAVRSKLGELLNNIPQDALLNLNLPTRDEIATMTDPFDLYDIMLKVWKNYPERARGVHKWADNEKWYQKIMVKSLPNIKPVDLNNIYTRFNADELRRYWPYMSNK